MDRVFRHFWLAFAVVIAVRLPRATAEALFREGGRPANFPPLEEGRAC